MVISGIVGALTMRIASALPVLILILVARFLVAADTDDAVAWGRGNIPAGKNTEGEELLRKALPGLSANAEKLRATTLTLIEVLRISGKLKEAHELCDGLLKTTPKDTALQSLKGELNVEV